MMEVVCAIVERGNYVLAACRGPEMRHPWKWEFPGGKVQEGESREAALHRELQEELGLKVEILEGLDPVHFQYPDQDIRLWPFRCDWTGGEPLPTEHAETVWIQPEDLLSLDFAEADLLVIEAYQAHRSGQGSNAAPGSPWG